MLVMMYDVGKSTRQKKCKQLYPVFNQREFYMIKSYFEFSIWKKMFSHNWDIHRHMNIERHFSLIERFSEPIKRADTSPTNHISRLIR